MKTIKSLLFLMVLSLGTVVSSPAQVASEPSAKTSPDALVRTLYKQHDNEQSPFFQTKSRALVNRYFAKDLADLLWKDAVSSKGEVGKLSGDPLYNAQDMDIKKFDVSAPRYADEKAEVTVSFENFGRKEEFVFLMVLEQAVWKIADIKYTDGSRLLEILRDDGGNR